MQLPYIKEVQQFPVILFHGKNIFAVKKSMSMCKSYSNCNNNCN